jgi:hypothetical protein
LERVSRVTLTAEEIADLGSPAPIACAPWWTPLYASTARDVMARGDRGPDDQTHAQRSQQAHAARLRAQATARANGRIPYNPFGPDGEPL